MGVVVEKFKLPSGMGALVRYKPTGGWTWQRFDRRRRKNVCTPTHQVNRSKAEQHVYQELAKQDKSTFRLQGVNLLFSTVAAEYFEVRESGRQGNRLRAASLRKLKSGLRAFQNYVGAGYGSLQISHVDQSLLSDFVQHEADRVSADSANLNCDFICGVLDYACKKGYVLHNAGDKVERAIAQPVNEDDDDGLLGYPCPTPDEVRLILANTKPVLADTGKRAHNGSQTGRPVIKGINQNAYTDLFTAVCLTGMRLGEARFLTWADVDFGSKVILIRPGRKHGVYWQPKTRASIRRIPIVPELETILSRLRTTNRKSEWVFETRRGTQLSASHPTHRLGEICRALGLRPYVLHSLRKYWASTVAQQGMDALVMLKVFGHSDFQLILSTYYAQNDDARLVAEASKIDFGLGLPRAS